MQSTSRVLPIMMVVLISTGGAQAGENWPHWRGPHGTGISDSTELPTNWSPQKNIAWKTPLPSWSACTPIIWGDRILITSPTASAPQEAGDRDEAGRDNQAQQSSRRDRDPEPDAGRSRGSFGRRPGGFGRRRGGFGYGQRRDPGGSTLLLICLSRTDGRILWQRELDDENGYWMKHNASSPSPVTDGRHVWAVTGTGAVAAFDMDGKPLWQRNLQEDYGEFGLMWGYGSSPLLYEGQLIIEVLHGNNTDEPSYLVALDGKTGEVVWRHERETDAVRESPDAYTTPLLVTRGGRPQIVVSGGDYVTGHDPDTGEELWRAGGLNPGRSPNWRLISSPVVAGDMLYVPTRKRPLLAFRLAGTGDDTTARLAWKWEDDAGPDVPTPVCDGTYFYMVDDRGVATCLESRTGKIVWGPQRTGLGNVSASPLLADGKLYIVSESGVTAVLAAGPEYNLLATNELDGSYTLSSLAVAGRRLFLRTSTHLYCIADERAAGR